MRSWLPRHSGTGIALLFAANHPERIRTLTNSDVHDNWPPAEFAGFLDLVAQTGDIFFDVKWSHWLEGRIPGARRRVELEGAVAPLEIVVLKCLESLAQGADSRARIGVRGTLESDRLTS